MLLNSKLILRPSIFKDKLGGMHICLQLLDECSLLILERECHSLAESESPLLAEAV